MSLLSELRRGLRTQLKRPGFVALMVGAMALGIGATATVSSIAYAVFLQPLPFKSPERLMIVWEKLEEQQGEGWVSSYPDFQDWRARSRSFEGMAISRLWYPTLRLRTGPTRLQGAQVSEDFFTVLGLQPHLGRPLVPKDFEPDAEPVVVLSHPLWQQLGGDPRLVGRTISLDGEPRTVVGVLPAGLFLGEPVVIQEAVVLAPLVVRNDAMAGRGSRFMRVVARLRPGITRQQAAREVRLLASALASEYPATNRDATAVVEPLRSLMSASARPALLALLGAAVVLLLATSVNVASLLLVQANARRRELAIRSTLGAARGRLVWELLIGYLPLVALGALLGLLLTWWTWGVFVALLPTTVVRTLQLAFDGRAVLATLLVTLLTAVLIGSLPALRVTGIPLADLLKEHVSEAGTGRTKRRAGGAVVTAELALSLILLIGAGLLIRSLIRLSQVELGFRSEGVLVLELDLPFEKYGDPHAAQVFLDDLIRRLEAHPRIRSAAVACLVPLKPGNMSTGMGLEPGAPLSWRVDLRGVGPGYFRTMGIPLVKGRDFSPQDGDLGVVLLNSTAARQLWPGADPVGKRVIVDWNGLAPRQVVGIVGDVRHESVDTPPRAEVYLPYQQMPLWSVSLVLRTAVPPLLAAGDARRQVRLADPDLTIVDVTTLEQLVASRIALPRIYMRVLVLFAAAALGLAAIGVYGVTAFAMTLRNHEIGVRMAFGARRGDLLRSFLVPSVRVIVLGVACGLAGACALTRFLQSLLFEVGSRDPLIFTAASVFLALVALCATCLPTWRAAQIDPVRILNQT